LICESIVPGWVDSLLVDKVREQATGIYPEEMMSWRKLHNIIARLLSAILLDRHRMRREREGCAHHM